MMIFILKNKSYFSSAYLSKLQQLHNDKKFHQMLGLKSGFPLAPTVSKEQLRKIYLELIKKYHSDRCHNDAEKAKLYGEISKLIISAYYNIEKIDYPEHRYKNYYAVEQSICLDLFGKSYNQAKYEMYKPGNQKMREIFLEQLASRTGQKYQKPQPGPHKHNNTYTQSSNNQFTDKQHKKQQQNTKNMDFKSNSPQQQTNLLFVVGTLMIFSLGSCIYSLSKPQQPKSKPEKPKQQYQQQISEINHKRGIKVKEKSDAMIKSLLKDQPPCLRYPDEQPHLFKQLTEFSIASDIHLYEVPAEYYDPQIIEKINKQPGILKQSDIFRINRIKPNTALTLSLQAERALHNIYVRVKDIIKQIEQTGRYSPPKIFISFHGYIMFQIRQKSLSLRNYKDTQYISLFDLYFDYYSPIFLKKDQFRQYLVGKDQPELFGWVYLNHRQFSSVYLRNNQKFVYFIPNRIEQWERLNRKIWDCYYRNYQDRWRPGGNRKERVGI